MESRVEQIRDAVRAGLPRRAGWVVHETSCDFDFGMGWEQPQQPQASWFSGVECQPEWSDLLVFGEYDVAQGGGAKPLVGVRRSDGSVWGLDIEAEGEVLFPFNTSLKAFIETFCLLGRYLGSGSATPPGLIRSLIAADPKAYPDSDWSSWLNEDEGE